MRLYFIEVILSDLSMTVNTWVFEGDGFRTRKIIHHRLSELLNWDRSFSFLEHVHP